MKTSDIRMLAIVLWNLPRIEISGTVANRVFRAGRRLVNISEFLPAQTKQKGTPSPPTCQTSRRLTLIVRKRFLATMLFFSGIVETTFGRRLNKTFDRLEKREGACALFVLSKNLIWTSCSRYYSEFWKTCYFFRQCPSFRLTGNPRFHFMSFNHTQFWWQRCVFRVEKFV